MSTPNSSSGDEDKSNRMEYNTLLANKNRSTAETSFGTDPQGNVEFWEDKHSHLPMTESLDFEEVESMIWRKVLQNTMRIYFCFFLHYIHDNLCTASSKEIFSRPRCMVDSEQTDRRMEVVSRPFDWSTYSCNGSICSGCNRNIIRLEV